MRRLLLIAAVLDGCAAPPVEEPVSISTPSASTRSSAPPPGAYADGSCSVVGELLADGSMRNLPEGIERRFMYRAGRLVEVTTAEGVEHVSREVFEYDARGRLERALETSEVGARPLGPLVEVSSYRYVESGDLLRITQTTRFGETVECALDPRAREARCRGTGSGAGTWTSLRRYDARGRLLSETHDYAASDSADLTLARSYDDAARTMRETRDFDSDGNIDREDVVTYDAAGRVVRVRTRGLAAGSKPATWVTTTAYDLDQAGRVACATTRSVFTPDGEPPEPSSEKVCSDYDPSGNTLRLTRARDGSGEIASFEGTFRNMRCGRFPRPDVWDDKDSTYERQIREEQLRRMMAATPAK